MANVASAVAAQSLLAAAAPAVSRLLPAIPTPKPSIPCLSDRRSPPPLRELLPAPRSPTPSPDIRTPSPQSAAIRIPRTTTDTERRSPRGKGPASLPPAQTQDNEYPRQTATGEWRDG